MQGNKTHEQHQRILERKDEMGKTTEAGGQQEAGAQPHDRDARQSEMPVSRGGMNQESRDHNKHNHGGQTGHGPQEHSPAEEKH